MTNDIEIRRLTVDDAAAFTAVRQEALVREPHAFLSSPDDDRIRDAAAAEVCLTAENGVVIGAFDAGVLVGMVGLAREPRRKSRHKAVIWGMYVGADARGRGVGAGLVAAAIEHARTWPGLRRVGLSVTEAATAARRLYERHGFVCWGTEPDGMVVDGRALAEHHMSLAL